ncbi:hypothetical protein AVEN_190094-1 [Araneus ventricosus]|uniref:Uncharacterized protein n=1 Tax=Araneus ventricosus TaxID=182803 RepID=A0A4Y2PG39_ARAVE|nr:hypothetical protein AVEN_68995-1 [Araneus ventricosus]GBM31356.1 hypothetical protein AVEN_205090-1 [Araneus ventricosus]GBN50968.1 hypothetical protein AVEN_190094-1 [Araneus ventricosus]
MGSGGITIEQDCVPMAASTGILVAPSMEIIFAVIVKLHSAWSLKQITKKEKSTLSLHSNYQLFKSPKSNFQVLNELFIHNMPVQKFYRNVLCDSTIRSNSFLRMLSRHFPVVITRFR